MVHCGARRKPDNLTLNARKPIGLLGIWPMRCRVCGIGVDGANAVPVEGVAARIGILIVFAERGLTDEEFEDFSHGGGIDLGRTP